MRAEARGKLLAISASFIYIAAIVWGSGSEYSKAIDLTLLAIRLAIVIVISVLLLWKRATRGASEARIDWYDNLLNWMRDTKRQAG